MITLEILRERMRKSARKHKHIRRCFDALDRLLSKDGRRWPWVDPMKDIPPHLMRIEPTPPTE